MHHLIHALEIWWDRIGDEIMCYVFFGVILTGVGVLTFMLLVNL